MKHLHRIAASCMLASGLLSHTGAMAAPAAAAIYQNTTNTASVELSNLEDSDTSQTLVPTQASPASGTARTAEQSVVEPSGRNAGAKPAKSRKKLQAAAAAPGSDEEQLSEEEDAEGNKSLQARDGTRGTSEARTGDADGTAGYSSYSSAGASGSGAPLSDSASSGMGGGSGGFFGTPSASSSTGSGTGTGAGTGSGSGTGIAGGNGGDSLPVPTSALESKLSAYRDMMLMEASNAQLTNPALARRYQMVDRSTYQSRLTR